MTLLSVLQFAIADFLRLCLSPRETSHTISFPFFNSFGVNIIYEPAHMEKGEMLCRGFEIRAWCFSVLVGCGTLGTQINLGVVCVRACVRTCVCVCVCRGAEARIIVSRQCVHVGFEGFQGKNKQQYILANICTARTPAQLAVRLACALVLVHATRTKTPTSTWPNAWPAPRSAAVGRIVFEFGGMPLINRSARQNCKSPALQAATWPGWWGWSVFGFFFYVTKRRARNA